MTQFKNVMDVFKLLDKSNCGKCYKPTCLAFAAAVFQGHSQLGECPLLDRDIVARLGTQTAPQPGEVEPNPEDLKARFHSLIPQIDLKATAERLDLPLEKGRLSIKTLGKPIGIDSKGNLSADIHLHHWILGPVLDYVLNGKGTPVAQKWVAFRELENGKTWERFFTHQCEKPLKKVADDYTDLFSDMVSLFNGLPVANHYQADISLVLYPLPKLPLLICYWKPEDGLDSSLNLFFDATAEDQLDIKFIYAIGTGLVRMFEKIALRHGL